MVAVVVVVVLVVVVVDKATADGGSLRDPQEDDR